MALPKDPNKLAEYKRTQSQRTAAVWADSVMRAKLIETRRSDVYRAKMSASISSKYKTDLVWVDKRLKAVRVANKNPLRRQRLSKALKGHKVTKQTRRKLALATKTSFSISHANKVEKRLNKFLQKYFPFQFELNLGKTAITYKFPDFVHTSRNLLIEVFGMYWHGFAKTGRLREQEEYRRKRILRKSGYYTLVVWEDELSNTDDLKHKIFQFLNRKRKVNFAVSFSTCDQGY